MCQVGHSQSYTKMHGQQNKQTNQQTNKMFRGMFVVSVVMSRKAALSAAQCLSLHFIFICSVKYQKILSANTMFFCSRRSLCLVLCTVLFNQQFLYLPAVFISIKQSLHILQFTYKKLRGLSPRANYTDRAAAAGRRS